MMAEHRVEIALQSSEKKETAADSQRVKDTESITESNDREQNERGDNQRKTYTKFIARVPEHMKEMKAFVPQVVSLGPFHYDSPTPDKVKKREILKEKHLLTKGRLSQTEKKLVDIILPEIKFIEQWYSIPEREWTHENERKLGRMMARDGLFLWRFLKENTGRGKQAHSELFEPKPRIQQDIMKLENQIPFFVVEMVFEWEADTDKDFYHSTLKRSCFTLCPFPNIHVDLAKINPKSHLLAFIYDNIIGSSGHSTYHTEHKPDNSLLSAAELEAKGVNFTAIKSPLALNQIRFNDISCRFYLPIIEMDSTTDVVMRNLLAFELYVCKGGTKPVRCYIDLMERLIDKVEDVKVLRDAGIIRNHLSDDKEVANVWNGMRDLLDHEKGEYGPIGTAIKDVRDFYNNKYKLMYAEFMKKYFSRPWVVVALVGGIIQLFLSLLQTILSLEQGK